MKLDPDMAMLYLDFVHERHAIYERRQAGLQPPWTSDPVLRDRKFTNVFRWLDPGSQFLISMLDDSLSERETLARCFLYRHTGRPETWDDVAMVLGDYPKLYELDFARNLWKQMAAQGQPFFTNAYLVYPQSSTPGTNKIDSIVDLTLRLFTPGSPDDVMPAFQAATTQQDRFLALKRNLGVGDFMSMQVLTDFGYTTEFREDEFVMAGPGAVKGIRLISPEISHVVLRWAQSQLACTLDHRYPSLMDTQNTFCEFFKYHRWLDKPPALTMYQQAHPGPLPAPIIPRKW